MEKQQKVQFEYQAEKTRIRRSFRQKQSERAKNHLSGETKVGLDEKRDKAIEKLKEEMKGKGADPEQVALIESIKRVVRESAEDNDVQMEDDPDSIPFVTEKNVSTHLGEEKSMQEVLELMINRLR